MTALDRFSPATRAWFTGAFAAPTAAQEGAWDAISSGRDTLVVAPTGSGKTLSAFLWSLDRLASTPVPEEPRHLCRVSHGPFRSGSCVWLHTCCRTLGAQPRRTRRGYET